MTDVTVAVSTRIRLARNVSGYAFPCMIRDSIKEAEITDMFACVFKRTGEFDFYKMSRLTEDEKQSFVERYLISSYLMGRDGGAVAVSKDGSLSVMINEEDHVREQIILRGFEPEKAYARITALDGLLKANVNFAVSGSTYYTACPSNLGTGMRVSVMMFLPLTVQSGEIYDLKEAALAGGLTIRGAFGEGSYGDGYFYQISNEVTYGVSGKQILSAVSDFTLKVAEREIFLRNESFRVDKYAFADRCFRALGVLERAAMIGYDELSECVVQVKLGISVGIIKTANPTILDDLLVAARPATLRLKYGLSADERVLRAEFVKEGLKKLAVTTGEL